MYKNQKVESIRKNIYSLEQLARFLGELIYHQEYNAFLFAQQIKSGTDGSIKDLCLKLHEWYNIKTSPLSEKSEDYLGMPSVTLILDIKEANNFGVVVLFGAALKSLKIEHSLAVGMWNGTILPYLIVQQKGNKSIMLHGERDVPFNPMWESLSTTRLY